MPALKKAVGKHIEKESIRRFGSASFPNEQTAQRQNHTKFDQKPLFSILVPLFNTQKKHLKAMLGSVLSQSYDKWQLCLADASDEKHIHVGHICKQYSKSNPSRILYKKLPFNEGIAANTNAAYMMSSGDYIGLLDHDDILHPSALFYYASEINDKNADFLYCDELTFGGNKIDNIKTLHFKPDYAPDNLIANNYICHFCVFSRKLAETIIDLESDRKVLANEDPDRTFSQPPWVSLCPSAELLRSGFNGSQDHDLILRLTDRANSIVHVPKILYYWRSHRDSTAYDIEAKTYAVESAKAAVSAHLKSKGFKNFRVNSTKAFPTIFRIAYELNKIAKISIIIPNKDSCVQLRCCIDSIRKKTLYPNYEIIIVENNSKTKEIYELYDYFSKQPDIKILKFLGNFNYSAINNFAAELAAGEYLLFLNNDTRVISPMWIEEMLMYAQRPDVGAVGAKLLFEDMSIQHAGVIIGLGAHRSAGHAHYKMPFENLGYMGRLCYAQDVSAVTGACLMISKKKFEIAGGFDTDFAVSLNDVDLCLKIRQLGYLNVFTPFAELIHQESATRGSDHLSQFLGSQTKEAKRNFVADGIVQAGESELRSGEAALYDNAARYEEESKRFKEKWRSVLETGDPYFNPNFSLDRSDFRPK